MNGERAPVDLARVRAEEFPWAGEAVFLNAASTGPLPRRSLEAVEEYNRRRATMYRLTDEDYFPVFTRSRELAARLINADPAEIALAHDTSYGLNVAARSLPLGPGDIVLTSEREFPANVYPWLMLERTGVRTELVPVTAAGFPDEDRLLSRLDDPRVKVLAISLVQFSNGYRIDLERFSRATRAAGKYLVVDAIQALGQIPVDVRATPVDILACGAQKWLLSPWGSGFFYVRKELVERLEPVFAGWMAFEGTDDFSRLTEYNRAFRADARRFEMITLPYQDFVGMNRSVELLLEVGVERIREHLRRLQEPVLEWAAREGVRITSPVGAGASGIICVAPRDAAAAYDALTRAGIVASFREGSIRLSPHLYNTVEELERVTVCCSKSS